MIAFVRRHLVLVLILTAIIIGIVIYFGTRDTTPNWTTDTVSTGTVRNLVSVSGVIDAVSTAELAFPTPGTLESIAVKEGDTVTEGQLLATLSHNDLKADYQDALASVLIAQADRDELINGISKEDRAVSQTTAEIARENLVRITKEQNEKVMSAYRTLLSDDLVARPQDKESSDTAPLLSGTYTCDAGTYTISTFASGAQSGYSYRLTGIEEGTFSAYTESSAPLGTCGLSIQFDADAHYGNSKWTITIPNTESTTYLTNKNAYDLASTQQTNAIHEAEQQLTLALQNNERDIATPRSEALARANARVLQAQARLDAISAQIRDHLLKAPFTGTITNIDPVPGETVTTAPFMTMVSADSFALTALIPEIDVTKITIGKKAEVLFDARPDQKLSATVVFISPLAKEIDGVSYFEAKLVLDTPADWLKSGLNADVDITIEARENVTRIPKRYVKEMDGNYTVLVQHGNEAVPTPVTIVFTGNDGFVEIHGIAVGTTIIAP